MNRGRPKGSVSREKQIHVRASKACVDQLNCLTELTGESKTEIIEKAIQIQYNLHNFGSDFDLN